MSTLKELFGANVRKFRKDMKLSQSELAERLDLSDEMIGKIERGAAGASFTTIEKLCEAFAIVPSELFPTHGSSINPENDSLGDIIVDLSRLNQNQLLWIKGILKEILKGA